MKAPIARRKAVIFLKVILIFGAGPGSAAFGETIIIDNTSPGSMFDGIGAVSGGGANFFM